MAEQEREVGASRRWWLLAAVLGCGAFVALAPSPAGLAILVLFAIAAPGVAAVTALRRGATVRPGWWMLVVGFGIAAAGEVVEFVVDLLDVWPDSGAAIDVVFLTAYSVQLFALMSMFRAQTVSGHRFGWFDSLAVGVAVGTVVWTTMYQAIFGHGEATPLDWLTRFGGAVLGVALVVTSLRLVVATRARSIGFVLLFAAFFLQLLTDSIAALQSDYQAGGAIDALWLVGYALMGAAMTGPDDTAPPARAASRHADVEIRHTLVLQAGVTLVLAGMMIVESGGTIPIATLAVWSCAWLAILVLTRTRVFGLLRLVGVASATENQQRLASMVASSNDVIGLADPDGRIRYLSPAIESMTGLGVDQWLGQRFDEALPRHLHGVDDVAVRTSMLGHGEEAIWESSVTSARDGSTRTIKLVITNRIETPEVNGWVIAAHDVTDEARLTSELRHLSLHDSLTGLANRALLFDRIQHSLDRMNRGDDAWISVVLIDIDDFKAVNDSLGHDTGDELLRGVAERLRSSVRQGDTVARLGGDEFAVLLEDSPAAEAVHLAERALESLALPVRIGAADFAISASVGVVSQRSAKDAVELLRAADLAMYASKREGKSRVTVFHDDMHNVAREQLELRMEMASALERGEFAVVYQPIVDTVRGEVRGVEALARWNHTTRGPISPADFIPIAEQSGQIHVIGSWVMRTACTEAASWTGAGAEAYISVNVSAPQLADELFGDLVLGILADTGLDPRRLLIEITESMLVNDTSHSSSTLARLRAHGIRVAIDDFGTGYSSLSYLRSMSVDVVKIDQSFVRDLATNADHRALTQSILALASGLEMSAIAEGVETPDDHAELIRMGCPASQGYLFSRPVPAASLRELFAAPVPH